MARIPPIDESKALPAAREELDRQRQAHGRVTNMKRTLAHSPAALLALMQWYPLHDEVRKFLGARLTTIFAHAVSTQSDCLICSTFFRRLLIESGEDPDRLSLDPREAAVAAYGRAIARDSNNVPAGIFDVVSGLLSSGQIVALTAFAAMMIATNIFNNVLEVDLDEYLFAYRAKETSSSTVV
jgi:alkylhydroperoxidase family enzyme